MGTRIDWRRARKLDLSEPGYKEQRLERAADNWIAGQSLDKRPKPKEEEETHPAANTRSPNRKPRKKRKGDPPEQKFSSGLANDYEIYRRSEKHPMPFGLWKSRQRKARKP